MREYVSKESVQAFPIRANNYDKVHGNEHFMYGIESVMEYVENLPPEDVMPIRHGKWEPGDPNCPLCGESKFKDLDADIWADWTPPYCPNCGARMYDKKSSKVK